MALSKVLAILPIAKPLRLMKTLNPFFVVGTIGMIVTAILHTFMTILIDTPSVHRAFMVLYPVFAALLTIGGMQILQEKKMTKLRIRAKNNRQ
jgi:hypothetical protein